ncbi:MAG: LPP20 family lipoprotein [Flavobacteriales bacterium]|nr:LPP20 family lipoprotein [Flavobacteriales bacterium]
MMRTWSLLLVVMIAGCKGGQKVAGTAEPVVQEQRPAWVQARPTSSAYYVGIGLANKNRPDAMESAKKNALNDLASEISVTVEGNSLLYTLDRRTQFDESFTSTIRTRSNEQLEGFELVDSYENGSEYWTYYRLSKSEHARIKAEKKAAAMRTAMDFRNRAQQSLAAGDLRTAFDQDLRALLAMKDHWGENDLVELEGEQVPLVNELYADLQKLTSGVQLSILPERCELTYANRFKREMLISAVHRSNGEAKELAQMPLFITYPGTGGKVTEMKNTDGEGRARTTIQRVDAGARTMEVLVKLDLDELIGRELDRTLVNVLVGSLTIPEQRAMIDLTMPKVFMQAQESNLGKPLGDAGVALAVREELTSNGFRFVERESDAELLLFLNANSRKGGESNGFFTAFLDVTYEFKDRRSQDIVFQGGKQGVKGVQLDYEKAGLESFKKAVPEIRKELVPGIMNSFN